MLTKELAFMICLKFLTDDTGLSDLQYLSKNSCRSLAAPRRPDKSGLPQIKYVLDPCGSAPHI